MHSPNAVTDVLQLTSGGLSSENFKSKGRPGQLILFLASMVVNDTQLTD